MKTMTKLLSNRIVALVMLLVVAAAISPAALAALPFVIGPTTDVSDLNEAMKIYFTDPINVNVVTDTEVLDLFMEDNNVQVNTTTGGRFIETAQYFRYPSGFGWRGKREYLPIPGAPKIKNSQIYLKKAVGVIQMEGEVMERVRTDMGAYIDYMDRAMPDFLEGMNDQLDSALLGYGNGARAVIDAINGNVVTVRDAFGVSGWTNAWIQFQEGESIVASVDADASPLRNANVNGGAAAGVVEDIDYETSKITFNAIPNEWAPGDFLFGGDATGHNGQKGGVDSTMMGLAGMVDDGSILQNFQGLDRSQYRLWRSLVIDGNSGNFSGDLDENVLTYADNQCFTHGRGQPNVILTSRTQSDKYWNSMKSDRVLNDPKAYEGGRGKLFVRLGDRLVPIRVGRKVPDELCYMLQSDTFRRWQLDGGKWDDKTGSVWNRSVDGIGRMDDFFAVYIWYLQTGNIAPRKNVRIDNLVP